MKRPCGDMKERITRYLDGELAEAEAKALEAHLASCGECRDELEATRTLRAAVAEVLAPASEVADRARILAAAAPLLDQYATRSAQARPWLGWLRPGDLVTAGALAASVVLAVMLVQGRKAGGLTARGPRSLPVYTMAESEAHAAGKSVKADQTIHLKGTS